jgi:hypothetical protein
MRDGVKSSTDRLPQRKGQPEYTGFSPRDRLDNACGKTQTKVTVDQTDTDFSYPEQTKIEGVYRLQETISIKEFKLGLKRDSASIFSFLHILYTHIYHSKFNLGKYWLLQEIHTLKILLLG